MVLLFYHHLTIRYDRQSDQTMRCQKRRVPSFPKLWRRTVSIASRNRCKRLWVGITTENNMLLTYRAELFHSIASRTGPRINPLWDDVHIIPIERARIQSRRDDHEAHTSNREITVRQCLAPRG